MAQWSVIALSINGGIKTLGAYAGLAAVVALALLALLFFAQARELKRLREFIEREMARVRLQPAATRAAGAPATPVPGAPPPASGTIVGVSPLATAIPAGQAVPPSPAPPGLPATPQGAGPAVAPGVAGVRRVPLPPGATPPAPGPQLPPAAPDATTISELPGPPLPPPPPPSAPRLIAERVLGLEPGSAHEIGDGVLLGRGKTAAIRLTDRLASGRHARVVPGDDGFVIEDLGSTNGTFVNGVQLSAPAALTDGDRIRLGESEFVFESPPALPQAPPPAFAGAPPPAPVEDATPAALGPPETETVVQLDVPLAAKDAAADGGDTPPPAGPTAAIPLRAKAVPERSLALTDEDAPARAAAPRSAAVPIGRPGASVAAAPSGVGVGPLIGSRRLRGFGGTDNVAPGRSLILLAAAVVAGIAVFAVVYVLVGGGSPAKHKARAPKPAAGSPTTNAAAGAPAPASVRVSVLNGTARAGLASKVSGSLTADGFAKGVVGDATQATVTTTTVAYAKGRRAAAVEVARALHLGLASVTPLTGAAISAAGIAGGHRPVVVTIGANYAG